MDDLIQDTYLKLCNDHCRLLRSFHPEHSNSIYGFVKVMAANVVHDHFKAERARSGVPGGRPNLSRSLYSPTRKQEQRRQAVRDAMERQIRLREVDEVLVRVAAGPDEKRNRMIFFLYYRQGLTAREIAALPALDLTTKGVESTIARLTRMIRSHITYEGFGRVKSL